LPVSKIPKTGTCGYLYRGGLAEIISASHATLVIPLSLTYAMKRIGDFASPPYNGFAFFAVTQLIAYYGLDFSFCILENRELIKTFGLRVEFFEVNLLKLRLQFEK
jgi:hypothetical protein